MIGMQQGLRLGSCQRAPNIAHDPALNRATAYSEVERTEHVLPYAHKLPPNKALSIIANWPERFVVGPPPLPPSRVSPSAFPSLDSVPADFRN
jgi:hypothetical protein